jgi:hypothetical protein
MKRFFLLLLAVIAVSACGTSGRVSSEMAQRPSWEGFDALQIIKAMGDPDRIDEDGRGGSILKYASVPDYDDPNYDILDPNPVPNKAEYAYFYLDDEGICYRVVTNRNLPSPPNPYPSQVRRAFWLDVLIWTPVLLLTWIL